MKQIQKTPEVMQKLQAAFGPDANLQNLAVFETVAMNTLPLRKTSGLFKGARLSLSLLSESASWINRESVPLQIQHDNSELPVGRLFFAQVVEDQLRALFAIDTTTSPDLVNKIESGVIDQVSVGQVNKSLACNQCGFNYLAPDASILNILDATCPDGHQVGVDGTFCFVDGLQSFFETSLVGMGAVEGAKIVGPTDARLANNEPFRLAASANRLGGLRLTCSAEEPQDVDTKEFIAKLEASAGEKAILTAQVTTLTAERDAAVTELTAAKAKIADLEPAAAELTASKEASDKAVAALTTEATTILTACNKPTDNLPKDVDGLLSVIAENRAAFAAAVPIGGKSNGANTDVEAKPATNLTAFRTRA